MPGFSKRMDRISSLPNEVICHIVSFLSAKEAAFTTVLSKRFQNLFTIIPNLRFDDSDKDEIQGSFTDFVDRVLALPASSLVRNFSIKILKHNGPAQYAHINRCLCAVLKRGILYLELDICVQSRYSLPFEVFTCKTVIELKLRGRYGSGFVVDVLPENAILPALETLVLNSIRFKDLRVCAFEKLLSACSRLKELIIKEMKWERWKWSGNLSSPTLQRLTICHGDFCHCDFTRITLDTPSLTYLDCSDVVPDEYQIVNLDSLFEAELDLMLTVDHNFDGFVSDYDTISSNPTNLIKGLKNDEIMNLNSPNTFQVSVLLFILSQ